MIYFRIFLLGLLFAGSFGLAGELHSIGKLTVPMLRALKKGVLPSYDVKKERFLHQGIYYSVLKGEDTHFCFHPIVSIGSDPFCREIISLNPDTSFLLQLKYQKLLMLFRSLSSPCRKEILCFDIFLELLIDFIKREVFSPPFCTEDALDYFLEEWIQSPKRTRFDFTMDPNGDYLPVIPIDDFIAAKTGVCRHLALVTTYFLDRLSQEESLPFFGGEAHFVRGVIDQGGRVRRHAWSLFIIDSQIRVWHIDTLWGLIKNLLSDNERTILKEVYGSECIDDEVRRFVLKN